MIYFSDSIEVFELAKYKEFFTYNLCYPLNICDSNLNELIMPVDNEFNITFNSDAFYNAYIYWLMSNDSSFVDFFTILMGEYHGDNVLVLTDLTSPLISTIVDCIISFIHDRYCKKAVIVSSVEDLLNVDERIIRRIIPDDIIAFESDKERFITLTVSPEQILKICETGYLDEQ